MAGVALVVACGASESQDKDPYPNGSGAGTGTSGSAGDSSSSGGGGNSTSSSGGTTSIGVGGDGFGDAPSFGGACAGDVITGELIPLDVYIMLDTSASMLEDTSAGTSKWDAIKTALASFLNDPKSSGLGVGIQYFPLLKAGVPETCTSTAQCGADGGSCVLKICWGYPGGMLLCSKNGDCRGYGSCVNLAYCSLDKRYICNSPGSNCIDADGNNYGVCEAATSSFCSDNASCVVADYTAADEEIQLLPDAASTLVASIDSQTPDGQTPMAPALDGAIAHAKTWATDHPDHTVVVVLATDGLPTQCDPQDITSIAALATNGVSGSPSILTYVIGTFAPDEAAALTDLDSVALAGGTEKAFVVDTSQDVAAQFGAALDAIRGTKLACEFKMPVAPEGETLDLGKVNVTFSSADISQDLGYVETGADCGFFTAGWYYDDPAAPTKIVLCPSACDAVQGIVGGQVSIQLGCETHYAIPK